MNGYSLEFKHKKRVERVKNPGRLYNVTVLATGLCKVEAYSDGVLLTSFYTAGEQSFYSPFPLFYDIEPKELKIKIRKKDKVEAYVLINDPRSLFEVE